MADFQLFESRVSQNAGLVKNHRTANQSLAKMVVVSA